MTVLFFCTTILLVIFNLATLYVTGNAVEASEDRVKELERKLKEYGLR